MPARQRRRGRPQASLFAAVSSSHPLLKSRDHGECVTIHARDIGTNGERWIEPFLAVNAQSFKRLELKHDIQSTPELQVLLKPGAQIGAIPLLSPSTQKVLAGLLIEPRFKWSSLGAVFNAIGYSVEPNLGGSSLVPGSAREVPPWLLAGPVIERISALMNHMRRGFVDRREQRTSPRGRVDWTSWATRQVPGGKWTSFPCQFTEPDHDPDLIAAIRWTLSHLSEELSMLVWSPPAKYLLQLTNEMQSELGFGPKRRPRDTWLSPGSSEWVNSAMEAMTWVAEDRGLGGARSLDGLAWNLSIDAVWEAWIASFSADLSRHLGMVASPFQSARRFLHWHGPAKSMTALFPDVELRSQERVVWIDAKYKRHLMLLAQKGWIGLSEEVRIEHRADLHQALAYASLADAPQVDTLLVYPRSDNDDSVLTTAATVTSGRRRVRLVLASVPFGFRNPEKKEQCLRDFRELLSS